MYQQAIAVVLPETWPGGKRGRGIQPGIRQRAHEVRRVRNYWAHESDEDPGPMTIDEARRRLQTYLGERVTSGGWQVAGGEWRENRSRCSAQVSQRRSKGREQTVPPEQRPGGS